MVAQFPYNYITFSIQDLGGGINQLSAENKIPEGFSESLLNVDPTPEGYLVKRAGYQTYAGNVPTRVSKIEYTTASTYNICFVFDGSVNLSSMDFSKLRSTPLIAFGRTNVPRSGDFTDTDTIHYYTDFKIEGKKEFLIGTHTLAIPSSEHGGSSFLFVNTLESTSLLNNSNKQFIVDNLSINKITGDISITYTNGTTSNIPGFISVLDRPAQSGITYITPINTCPANSTTTISIPAATHGLSNFNILGKVFIDDGVSYTEIIPDSLQITSTGQVNIIITNSQPTPIDVIAILTAANISDMKTGVVSALSTNTITISNITGDSVFVSCYLETSPSLPKEQVIPDSIEVDSNTKECKITFVNNNNIPVNFYLYYITKKISFNKLCVTGAVISSPYEEEEPQITIWGLDHEEIYGDNPSFSRVGWVNHIDTYKSAGTNKVICGLGGNFFEAGGYSNTHLLPTLYPYIRNRISTNTTIGPTFVDSSNTSTRTRGYIKFDGAEEGWGTAVCIKYVANNQMKYLINCPNMTIVGTLSNIIEAGDILTVIGAGYKVNNGKFKILSVTALLNTLEIIVENKNINSDDFDELTGGARCGIFSDKLPLFTPVTFIKNDVLKSGVFTDEYIIEVVEPIPLNTVRIDGAYEILDCPAGVIISAKRFSSVIPLQNEQGNPSVLNLVRGDIITYTGLDRELRIKYINPFADQLIDISGDGEEAIITLLSGNTRGFFIGQNIILLRAGNYTGIHTIIDIPSNTTLKISSSETTTISGATLQGYTIEIDESFFVEDDYLNKIEIIVPRRWIPIEKPETQYNLPKNAIYRYLTADFYSEQPIVRSTMVADNLYLTNGEDVIYKYDGENIYRAGLTRWQAGLFFTIDTTPAPPELGKIEIPNISCSTAGNHWSNNKFEVDIADKNTFIIGDKIKHSATNATYTVIGIDDDNDTSGSGKGFIIVDRLIPGTPIAGTLKKVYTYKYYFRLNTIDKNNNIISSAITGYQDNIIELSESAQVRMRLIGLPVIDIYDYDRIEVEIYRTKGNTVAPFYKLSTIAIPFNFNDGYINFIDTNSDDTLVDLDVTSALTGQELGTQLSPPLKAKYITSIENRLVLANIKSYPKFNINLIDTGQRITKDILVNKSFLFRIDNTLTSTVTDCISTKKYVFVDKTTAVTINPTTDITNNSGNSFTITKSSHGLSPGDWVYLFHNIVTNGNKLEYAGLFMINSVTTNTFTILHKHDASYTLSSKDVNRYVTAPNPKDIPVLLDNDGNYSQLFSNPDINNAYEFTAVRRLANIINISSRKVDTSLSAFKNFKPWLIANAGSEFSFGQIIIDIPRVLPSTPEVVLPSNITTFSIYVNNIKRSSGQSISATTNIYPSRILISYENYPEVFDNPESILDIESDSAIDINPSDGQEITGIIPFFGESSFGEAQKSDILVVFKTNSIYVVSITAKNKGQQYIQKVDSRGLGCTAPYSIAHTKNGIMFANDAGIFRLGYDLNIYYIGRYISRLWENKVDLSKIHLFFGHFFKRKNKYKLSLPFKTDKTNDKVLVYDSVREYVADGYRDGSWTLYNNHPCIGWANLTYNAFFASTLGRVFIIRNSSSKSDFRDDNKPINAEAILRAIDFGAPDIRKTIPAIILNFRVINSSDNTKVSAAIDFSNNFKELDIFSINNVNDLNDSLSDTYAQKISTIRYSLKHRKLYAIQLKLANNTIDDTFELCGVSMRVAGLNHLGISEAADKKILDN